MVLEFQSRPAAEENTPVEMAFKLDGAEFRCVMRTDGDAILEWSELAAAASEADEVESAAGASFVARFFKLMMPADQYAAFRAHMRSHHTPGDILVEVMQAVNAEMQNAVQTDTDRPTGRPSPSSPGRGPRAERTARIISLSGEDGDIEWEDGPGQRKQPQDHRRRQQQRRRTG